MPILHARVLFQVSVLALTLLIWQLASGDAAAFASQSCTNEMARVAESDIDGINDWQRLYKAFRKYGVCDQASIAEGYDDIVVRLLTRGWDGGSAATALVKKDHRFGDFILRHITELASKADLDQVKVNATSKCSADATRLCGSIAKTVGSVIATP